MMLLEPERIAIVEYGRKLLESHLTSGTGGNLSVYNRAAGLVAIKPSGVDYMTMEPEDVVVMTIDGQVVEGIFKPSNETPIHLGLLNYRPDINAVIHTHSVYATTLACLNWELPAVNYLIAFSGNKVPLAKYATFGTPELADNVIEAIGQYNACLMANHGMVSVGQDIAKAFTVAEEIELVAQMYYQAKCIGEPVVLPDAEVERVATKFQGYGQKS